MREFLFRGKTKQGEWVYGLLGCNYFRPNEKYYYIHNCETDDIEYEVIPETVGQFTGITDKNGKKIFEGDIVKGCWNTIFEVYFDDCYLQYRAKAKGEPAREIDYYGENYRLEVIGNIHDQDIGEKKNG